jgi:hypothetical protein
MNISFRPPNLDTLYGHLTPPKKELVILGVARARGARYEWHQHVDMARKKGEGVTTEEMRAIGGGEFVGWTPSDERVEALFGSSGRQGDPS